MGVSFIFVSHKPAQILWISPFFLWKTDLFCGELHGFSTRGKLDVGAMSAKQMHESHIWGFAINPETT